MTNGRIGFSAGVLLGTSLFASAIAVQAQTVVAKVITAGSSAQFGVFSAAAQAILGGPSNPNVLHFTTKGTCNDLPCAFLLDERFGSTAPPQSGTLSVVWGPDPSVSGQTDVYAYLSVDSVVGVSLFLATPRAHLEVSTSVMAQDALNIWTSDSELPPSVWEAINDHELTAANTDIRPEDALFATNRALSLGYTTATGIKETITIGSGFASPIPFGLGTDPLTGAAVDPFVTIPVGGAPVIFLANAQDTSGLGSSSVTNINVNAGTNEASLLFSGQVCDATIVGGSSSKPVDAILRELTSGTMNTTEYTSFVVNGGLSQETNIGSADNPLNQTCASVGGSGGGSRFRAIGTGDEVKAVANNTDSIGYLFFSHEAAPPTTLGTTGSYKYLQVDGIDPINPTYGTGQTPACTNGTITTCAAAVGSSMYDSFPHLRDGTYHEWTMYRLIADHDNSTAVANAQALVNEAQIVADTSLPDFVPIYPQCGGVNGLLHDDPGWQLYREHFAPSGVLLPTDPPPFNPTVDGVEQPNDGPNLFANANPSGLSCNESGNIYFSWTLAGTDPSATDIEVGGDVGGTIIDNHTKSQTSPGATPGSGNIEVPSPH